MESQFYEKVNLAPLYVKDRETYKAVLAALVEIGKGFDHGLAVKNAANDYGVEPAVVDRYCSAYVNAGRW
jgi:hypothetical protein